MTSQSQSTSTASAHIDDLREHSDADDSARLEGHIDTLLELGLDHLATVTTPYCQLGILTRELVFSDITSFLSESDNALGSVCTRPTELSRVRLLLTGADAEYLSQACKLRGLGHVDVLNYSENPDEFRKLSPRIAEHALSLDPCGIRIHNRFDVSAFWRSLRSSMPPCDCLRACPTGPS